MLTYTASRVVSISAIASGRVCYAKLVHTARSVSESVACGSSGDPSDDGERDSNNMRCSGLHAAASGAPPRPCVLCPVCAGCEADRKLTLFPAARSVGAVYIGVISRLNCQS